MTVTMDESLDQCEGLRKEIESRHDVFEEVFENFATAEFTWSIRHDSHGRQLVVLTARDSGRIARTGFAPTEFQSPSHLRNRFWQFLKQVIGLDESDLSTDDDFPTATSTQTAN